jgi:hypothetical protein
LDEVYKLDVGGYDHGIYQVYGSHPVYGSQTLIYIGEAYAKTFSERVKQHAWETNYDMQSHVDVNIGRFAGYESISNSKWDRQIHVAEKLLIRAHSPAYNQHLFFKVEEHKQLSHIHILNWGERRLLLPEVSGAFWTNKFWDDEPRAFGSKKERERSKRT